MERYLKIKWCVPCWHDTPRCIKVSQAV